MEGRKEGKEGEREERRDNLHDLYDDSYTGTTDQLYVFLRATLKLKMHEQPSGTFFGSNWKGRVVLVHLSQ